MKTEIGVRQQRILKGIAIILMMMIHFWQYPEWIFEENMYKSLISNSIYIYIGRIASLSVAMFSFLIGYGLCINTEKWDNVKYRIRKLVTFLVNYWIYCLIYIITGVLILGGKFRILRFSWQI